MANFSFTRLALSELLLVRGHKFVDSRGYFMETYSRRAFEAFGVRNDFVQDNYSISAKRGTVRGLHFQVPPAAQAKLVRTLKGSVFDVAVDLRRKSPTFGRWCGVTLTADNADQLFIPAGFAHAFCTLEPDTEVAYKTDRYYDASCDSGIFWNDPAIGIEWPIGADEVTLSAKDAGLPRLAEFDSPFTY